MPSPNEPPQRQSSVFDDMRNAAYWLAFITQTLAVSVEVLLHRRMGSRSVHIRGFAAFLLIPIWTAFFPHDNLTPMYCFWLLFILGCARQRLSSLRGDRGHSRYTGEPSLQRLFPKCGEIVVKKTIEPLFVIVAGLFCLDLSQALGSYLITAGIGLGVSVGLGEAVNKAKVRELNDARLEQQSVIDRFREQHGEN